MKKLTAIMLYLFFGFSIALASSDLQTLFTQNFNKSCYQQTATISNVKPNEVIKIIHTTNDIIPTQSDILLNYKVINNNANRIDFEVVSKTSGKDEAVKNINDGDEQTAFQFDIVNDKQKEIVLKLSKLVNTNEVISNFTIANNTQFEKYFSIDGKKRIKANDSQDYDFQYIKLVFPNYKDGSESNPKIFEIQFTQSKKSEPTILIKSNNSSDIVFWNTNKCLKFANRKYQQFLNKYGYENNKLQLPTDINTKTITLNREKNPFFDENFDSFVPKDSDEDGIDDVVDNCMTTYNPIQKDKNSDGVGDLCADDDKDGIVGSEDNCPYIANPDQKDVNNNGIGDVCEFDKDKDNIPDGIDNCINKPNPDQQDDDKDGIGNVCDNCNERNPNQKDEDNNGIGDVCDDKVLFEKNNDKDKDGVLDFDDNCVDIANKGQEDSDKDGVGDVCDNCVNIQNKDQKDKNSDGMGDLCEDVDEDGIVGYQDNCPYIANADQKDADNDGKGDLCEDDDHDGVLAGVDNCPYKYNPNQRDVDGDGKGDVCDKDDNRFIESNKRFFIGAGILIVMIFGVGIWFMIRKLKK